MDNTDVNYVATPVVHEGTHRRVVLIVDCWYPDLTEEERKFLERLFRANGVT